MKRAPGSACSRSTALFRTTKLKLDRRRRLSARSRLCAGGLAAILGSGFTSSARAQEAPELEAGARVRVSSTACPDCFVMGRLQSFDADGMSLRLDGETMGLPMDSIASMAVSRGKSWVPPVVGGVGAFFLSTGIFLAGFCNDPDTSCQADTVLVVSALIGLPSAGIGTLLGFLLRKERWQPVPLDGLTVHVGPGGVGFGVSLGW